MEAFIKEVSVRAGGPLPPRGQVSRSTTSPRCPFQAVLVPAPVNTFSGESQVQGATLVYLSRASAPLKSKSRVLGPCAFTVPHTHCRGGWARLLLSSLGRGSAPAVLGRRVVRSPDQAHVSETGRERDSLLKSKGLSKPCALVAPSTRGPAHCPSALRTTPGWEKPFRTEVTGMNGPTPKSRLAWNAAPQSIRCLPVRPWTPLA